MRRRRPHGLRHGQGRRARSRDRERDAQLQVGRAKRRMAAPRVRLMKAAVITVSTSKSKAGVDTEDESGPALEEWAREIGLEIAGRELIPDDGELIAARLRHWADDAGCALVLTTGGTGFDPADVTPEATRAVIEREAPGIGEAMRAASREHTRNWMLSRGVAGARGRTLIINFPGSPKSIGEAGEAIREAIPHAVGLLGGQPVTRSHGH